MSAYTQLRVAYLGVQVGFSPPLQMWRSLNRRAGRLSRSTRSLTMATLILAMPPSGMMAWQWKGHTLIPKTGETLRTLIIQSRRRHRVVQMPCRVALSCLFALKWTGTADLGQTICGLLVPLMPSRCSRRLCNYCVTSMQSLSQLPAKSPNFRHRCAC